MMRNSSCRSWFLLVGLRLGMSVSPYFARVLFLVLISDAHGQVKWEWWKSKTTVVEEYRAILAAANKATIRYFESDDCDVSGRFFERPLAIVNDDFRAQAYCSYCFDTCQERYPGTGQEETENMKVASIMITNDDLRFEFGAATSGRCVARGPYLPEGLVGKKKPGVGYVTQNICEKSTAAFFLFGARARNSPSMNLEDLYTLSEGHVSMDVDVGKYLKLESIAAVVQDFTAVDNNVARVDELAKANEHKIDELSEDVAEVQSKLTDVARLESIAAVVKDFTANDNNVARVDELAKANEHKIDELSEDVAELQHAVREVDRWAESNEEIRNRFADFESANELAIINGRKIEELSVDVAGVQSKVTDVERSAIDMAKSNEENVALYHSRILDLERDFQHAVRDVDQLAKSNNGDVDRLAKSNEEIRNRLADYFARFADLENWMQGEMSRRDDSIMKAVAALQDEMKGARIGELAMQLAAAKSTIESQQKDIAKLQVETESLQRKLNRHSKKFKQTKRKRSTDAADDAEEDAKDPVDDVEDDAKDPVDDAEEDAKDR